MQTLVLSFAQVLEYRLYRLDNASTQIFGSQGRPIDKRMKRFRDVAANFVALDCSRPLTLLKFLEDIRVGFSRAYVSEEMAFVTLGRLVSKEAVRLYSFYMSPDTRTKHTAGTVSWPGLLRTHLQRYLADAVLSEAANKSNANLSAAEERQKSLWRPFG